MSLQGSASEGEALPPAEESTGFGFRFKIVPANFTKTAGCGLLEGVVMRLPVRTFELMFGLAITFTIVALLGCGNESNPADKESTDRSATITFQLNIDKPLNHSQNIPVNQAIGEPDICNDYLIDRIGVQLYRTQDDSEVASAEEDCGRHSITVYRVPEAETLYLVCKGYVDGNRPLVNHMAR